MNRGRALALLLVASLSTCAMAAEPLQFDTEEQEARFLHLTREMRCLVCQNQNLADSDAPLAEDLRVEIHEMLMAGRTDEEIRSFLVDRYGEFVLYRPGLGGNTLLLWLLPALLLTGGAIVILVAVRRRSRLPPESEPGPHGNITE
jgi:cytochrome c-type biogenesis protein CcmH